MKLSIITFTTLTLFSIPSFAKDVKDLQHQSGKQNIAERNLIETTRQIVDSEGFVDMDAQSRSFLSTDFKGIPIEDYEDTNDYDAHIDAS
jgi:hypothetical protein